MDNDYDDDDGVDVKQRRLNRIKNRRRDKKSRSPFAEQPLREPRSNSPRLRIDPRQFDFDDDDYDEFEEFFYADS